MATKDDFNDADAAFVKAMIPHHRAAVKMAQAVLKNGKNPEIKKLAKSIFNAQQDEIEFMSAWLKQRSISGTSPEMKM